MSRRRLTSWIAGGALTGAAWTTGLTVLARGRHPQVFVLGRDEWQVLLVEHGTNRVVILAGTFRESPEREINRLCGLLRQHIDVVACERDTLNLLSAGFRDRRTVTTVIDLDGTSLAVSSQRFISLSHPIRARAGALDIDFAPLPNAEWRGETSNGPIWIAHVTIGDVVMAIGPTLDAIAGHGRVETNLAIAPGGDIARLWRTFPGIAIAANAQDALDSVRLDPPAAITPRLVRTFGRDIAHFVIRNGRIELPEWSQDMGTESDA